jgi:TetR/AcrR family transcriptional repressor of nem operon
MTEMKTTDTKERLLEAALELITTESYGSVSVDDICEKANVKKGSFYYFFPSKADLAVAAFEACWQKMQPSLDQIFSIQNPPLKRLTDFFDAAYAKEKEKMDRAGHACGCPFTSVGSEQGTQDEKLREGVLQILERLKKYFESALRDAAQEGLIQINDVKEKVDELFAFYLGLLTQVRIMNSLDPLKNVRPALFRLMGVDAAKVGS